MSYLRVKRQVTIRRTRLGNYLLVGDIIMEINEGVEAILALCDGRHTADQIVTELAPDLGVSSEEFGTELTDFVALMIGDDILEKIEKPHYIQPIYIPDRPSSLAIELTYTCNQHCVFCLRDAGTPLQDELCDEEWETLIDECVTLGVEIVNITGGEPLLKRDLVLRLAKKLSEHGLKPIVLTNGLLITPGLAEQLYNAGVRHVQVSIDGPDAALHDRLRGSKRAFEGATRGIDCLRRASIEVGIAVTLNRVSFPALNQIRQLTLKLGDTIKIGPVWPMGRGKNTDYLLTPQQYAQYLVAMDEGPDGHLSSRIIPRERCSMGTAPIIAPGGDVYPCMAAKYEALKMGNVRQSSLQEIYRNSQKLAEVLAWTVDDIPGCCDCWNKLFCGAGCRGNAYALRGTIYASDPYRCFAYKHFAHELLSRGDEMTRQALSALLPETALAFLTEYSIGMLPC